MDYTYVSESVLLKMKNQEQNQESSPSKTSFSFGLLFFCDKEEERVKGIFFPLYEKTVEDGLQ